MEPWTNFQNISILIEKLFFYSWLKFKYNRFPHDILTFPFADLEKAEKSGEKSHTKLGTEATGEREEPLPKAQGKEKDNDKGIQGIISETGHILCALGSKFFQQNEHLSQGLNLESFHVRVWIGSHERP